VASVIYGDNTRAAVYWGIRLTVSDWLNKRSQPHFDHFKNSTTTQPQLPIGPLELWQPGVAVFLSFLQEMAAFMPSFVLLGANQVVAYSSAWNLCPLTLTLHGVT
jgi:hypothetical protein